MPEGQGLILEQPGESRVGSAIHMWAVFFPIGVAWVDAAGGIVDLKVARPWGIYFPNVAARYVLEGSPSMLESLAIGERLEF